MTSADGTGPGVASSGRARHWDDRYRSADVTRVSWYEAEPTASLAVLDAIGVTATDSVIDVGGGTSGLAAALVRRGATDVTVLDVSEAALHLARGSVASSDAVSWTCADVTSWTPNRTWDVWHDRAVFHFLVDEADRERYRRALLAAVPTGGVAVVATFAPDGPDSCSGLPVRRYDADHLVAELGGAFTEITRRRVEHVTPSGAVQPFTWIAARRSAHTTPA